MNNDERQAKDDQNHKLIGLNNQSNQSLILCMATLTGNNGMDLLSHAVYITSDNVRCKIVPCILENLVCDF